MKLTIEIPEQYAIAVRAELRRRGYNDSEAQVRRTLRYVIRETMERRWWRTIGVRFSWGPAGTAEEGRR